MKRRGRFITLEGGEGAGKSTQARRLADWLREKGVDVVLTREPGGSPRAELLRELLLSGRVKPFGPDAEALIFAIARADHVAETIAPELATGTWVICDRFIDSTRAYQGSAGASSERLDQLDEIAVGRLRPDLTLVLDLPPELGLQRIRGRNQPTDRFETDGLAAHEARRGAFLAIAGAEPDRCVLIDAAVSETEIAEKIRSAVAERLGPLPAVDA